MEKNNFEDFYQVPSLNFDISKLRDDLQKVLKIKDSILQVSHTLVQ